MPRKSSDIKPSAGKRSKFPTTLSPMLATLVDHPVDIPGWLYEVKWDGYRAIAMLNKGAVQLLSRNNKSFDDKFYPVYHALETWKINAILDGEIVVLTPDGISNFSRLQNWRSEADGELIYYVFDLLWLNGYDLTQLPLIQRRELLEQLFPAPDIIRLSTAFRDTSSTKFLSAARSLGLEGIIAKKEDSNYYAGARSRDWLKIKINKRHEVVIGGYTRNENSSKSFSSLLVGVFEKGELVYTGKIGTGFTSAQQKEMLQAFKPLIRKTSPFSTVPDVNKPSRFRPNPPKATSIWLNPQLVCEVSYAEITTDGVMRHPSFEGMRIDKAAKDVGKEEAMPVAKAVRKAADDISQQMLTPVTGDTRKTLLNPTEATQVRKVNTHELKFTNLNKIFWPEEKYTKRDMLNYYYQVAAYILPYLKDRPQSLNRFPNGINGKSFYQKDVTGKAPDWIKTFPYHTGEGEDKNFMVCTDEASLLYMANLGAVEMNPWNSKINKPDHPDWCIIDLDPTEKNTFEEVIRTAQVTKEILDSIKVPGYCKTSGSTGIHIYIPLNAKYTYEDCQLFGKWIATQVRDHLPSFTSIERMTQNRKGKIYVDYLQNRPKATLAAPYSLRPKLGATVSMPLHWDEVKKGLKMKDFNITNAIARINEMGDIFKPVLGKGIDMKKILRSIQP